MASSLDLRINDLAPRHPGLTAEIAGAYYQAACASLARYHEPPTQFMVSCDGLVHAAEVNWSLPESRWRRAHGNRDDCVRDGAYAVAIGAVECAFGLLVVGRSERRSGCDYYAAPQGRGLDENGDVNYDDPTVRRVEISGTDEGSVEERMKDKKAQVQRPSGEGGIAAVVGFQKAIVSIQTVASTVFP